MASEARHRFGFSVRGDNLPIQSAAVFHPSGYGTPAEMLGGDPRSAPLGPQTASLCRGYFGLRSIGYMVGELPT